MLIINLHLDPQMAEVDVSGRRLSRNPPWNSIQAVIAHTVRLDCLNSGGYQKLLSSVAIIPDFYYYYFWAQGDVTATHLSAKLDRYHQAPLPTLGPSIRRSRCHGAWHAWVQVKLVDLHLSKGLGISFVVRTFRLSFLITNCFARSSGWGLR